MELSDQDLLGKGKRLAKERGSPLKVRADSLPEDSKVMISQSTVS